MDLWSHTIIKAGKDLQNLQVQALSATKATKPWEVPFQFIFEHSQEL